VSMIDASRIGRFPRRAIGVLSPLAGSDTMPYSFYRLLGPDYIVISTPLALASFKPEDLDRAVAAIDDKLGHLVSRGADLILQSGTPLALSLGPEALQRLLGRLRERSRLPVISSMLNAIAAARALGVKKIVAANKWNDTINRQLAAFFAHGNIEVLASAADSQEPAHFQSADLRQGSELAYTLGRDALTRAPQADALFIGGGAWLAEPAAERIEREFGKPVITSHNGAVRAILKELGEWRPFPPGFGRVLEAE
jgi:maleate cis-trans isomerase